jgi:hypothetical protein
MLTGGSIMVPIKGPATGIKQASDYFKKTSLDFT